MSLYRHKKLLKQHLVHKCYQNIGSYYLNLKQFPHSKSPRKYVKQLLLQLI